MLHRKWGLQAALSLPGSWGNDGLVGWGVAPKLTVMGDGHPDSPL